MLRGDYIKTIVFGLGQYPDFLSDYFYRQHLSAKEKHISALEFFNGLKDAYSFLLSELQLKYYHGAHTFSLIQDAQTTANNETENPPGIPESYGMPLFEYIKCIGENVPTHISLKDLNAVIDALQSAFSKVTNELNNSAAEKGLDSVLNKIWALFDAVYFPKLVKDFNIFYANHSIPFHSLMDELRVELRDKFRKMPIAEFYSKIEQVKICITELIKGFADGERLLIGTPENENEFERHVFYRVKIELEYFYRIVAGYSKDKPLDENENNLQMDGKFDIEKYDLTVSRCYKRGQKPVLKGDAYCVYDERKTGIKAGEKTEFYNSFQYFRVAANSKAGNFCKKYYEKYYVRNEWMGDMDKNFVELVEGCKIDAINNEIVAGLPAYLKFWKECLTDTEKINEELKKIYLFEALQEWYNLRLAKHIQDTEPFYLNDYVKSVNISQWKNEQAHSVEIFLKSSERRGQSVSKIDIPHATELIKFHGWIMQQLAEPGQAAAEIESQHGFNSSQPPIASRTDEKQINEQRLTQPEIALLYIYNSKNINGIKDAVKIAANYGYDSQTSGKILNDEFAYYKQTPNRTNPNDGNKRSVGNMIKRIENVLPYIENTQGKKRAESEIKLLQKNLSNSRD